MVRYACLILATCCTAAARAQLPDDPQRPIDSLVRSLAIARTDTDSLRTIIALSTITNGDDRMSYGRQGLALAERCMRRLPDDRDKFLTAEAIACSGIGLRLRQTGQPDSATAYYERGLKAARAAGDRAGEANLINGMGVVFYMKGDIPGALERMNEALAIRTAIGDTLQLGSSCMNIASMYHMQGNIPQALAMYDRARRLSEKNDPKVLAAVLVNLGALHETQGELDSALACYHRAIGPLHVQMNTEGEAIAYNNMATVQLARKNYTAALEAVSTGIPIARGGRHYNVLCDLYFKRSRIHEEQGELDAALADCERSIQVADSGSIARGIAYGYVQLAKIHEKRGDLDAALRSARLATERGGGYDELNLRKDLAQTLARVYEARKDYRNALEQFHLYRQLADSITNEKNRKELIRNGFKYEYDRKEALLQAEQEKQDAVAREEIEKQKIMRNAYAASGTLVLLLLAGLYRRYTFKQRTNRQLAEKNAVITREKQRSDDLLHNILPEEVAEELKATGAAQARHFDQATILFTDFKGFTTLSERLTPAALVAEIDGCFKAFDAIVEKYRIEKIKTIGDAYMAAGGLPDPRHGSPLDVVKASLEMQAFMARHAAERAAAGQPTFEMRVGIHTGPVVAGIVGVKKFAYDIWGDTVNIASRMESSGEAGRVNISESTHALVKGASDLRFVPRGKVSAKGKGELEMYFVTTG